TAGSSRPSTAQSTGRPTSAQSTGRPTSAQSTGRPSTAQSIGRLTPIQTLFCTSEIQSNDLHPISQLDGQLSTVDSTGKPSTAQSTCRPSTAQSTGRPTTAALNGRPSTAPSTGRPLRAEPTGRPLTAQSYDPLRTGTQSASRPSTATSRQSTTHSISPLLTPRPSSQLSTNRAHAGTTRQAALEAVRPRHLAKYRLPGICLALIGLMTVFVGIAMLAIGDDSKDSTPATTRGVICIVVGGVLLVGGFLQQHIVHRKHKQRPPAGRHNNGVGHIVPDLVDGRAANYVSSVPEADIVLCDIADGEEGDGGAPKMNDDPIWFTTTDDCVDVKL
ncbi:hypothetical protein LSAT2_005807, partial [Lamellibrachia satsuma]